MKKRSSGILFSIKNRTLLKHIFYKLLKGGLIRINSAENQNIAANYTFNYKYDCRNPRSFNEYLGWIKSFYSNDLWEKCADKLGGKQFLRTVIDEKYLPETLCVFRSVDEIDLSKLPQRFVLKTNNDSGSVFICDQKSSNFDEIFLKLKKALNSNYCNINGEWIYKNIKPVIFAEEFLESSDPLGLCDYKFFVYNGKYKWGYIASNRNIDCRFDVFEGDCVFQNVDYIYLRSKKKRRPLKPAHFSEMVKIAEEIGKYFWFVRVDFYETVNGIKVGELTFFTHSGLGPFTKKYYDFKYGKLFLETPFAEIIRKEGN